MTRSHQCHHVVCMLNCMQTSGQTTAGKDKNSLGWTLLDPKLVVRTCSAGHTYRLHSKIRMYPFLSAFECALKNNLSA